MTWLEAIRERVGKATAGPWEFVLSGRVDGEYQECEVTAPNDETICDNTCYYPSPVTQENQELIAHSRQDIPRLLEVVEKQKKALEAALKCLPPADAISIRARRVKNRDRAEVFSDIINQIFRSSRKIVEDAIALTEGK